MRDRERLALLQEAKSATEETIRAVDALPRIDRTMTISEMRTHLLNGNLTLDSRVHTLKAVIEGREEDNRRALM